MGDRIVVVGASAGGVSAVAALVAQLPRDFRAPLLVTMHIARDDAAELARALMCGSALPAHAATDGEPLVDACIYVAPADRHLSVYDGRVCVKRGPRDRHFRPSIDVLFRSTAYHYGARAVGIVMSGRLSDGSAGLQTIRRLGGIAMVQEPADAEYADMPRNALRATSANYVLDARMIGYRLASLISEPVAEDPPDDEDYRRSIREQIELAASEAAADD